MKTGSKYGVFCNIFPIFFQKFTICSYLSFIFHKESPLMVAHQGVSSLRKEELQ